MIVALFGLCLTLSGCDSTMGDRAEVRYATLPTREVMATFPADFAKVEGACRAVVQGQNGYELSNEDSDLTTGRSRFEGTSAEAGTIRLEAERSRDLLTTSVKIMAVDAGATEGNSKRAREILDQIESMLWSGR